MSAAFLAGFKAAESMATTEGPEVTWAAAQGVPTEVPWFAGFAAGAEAALVAAATEEVRVFTEYLEAVEFLRGLVAS